MLPPLLVQVVQAVHPAASPGLRETYTQSLNVVIRKELRLYVSNLRKAVAAALASNPAEPDMGLAHKRVSGLHRAFPTLPLSCYAELCSLLLCLQCLLKNAEGST